MPTRREALSAAAASAGAMPGSVPLDELALATEQDSVRQRLDRGEQTGAGLTLVIPEETRPYVEQLLSRWGTERGAPYQLARLQPVELPSFHPLELLELTRALIDERLLSQVVILGSAALWLHGLPLNRVPRDLDLFVSDETFRDWPTQGFQRLPHGDKEKIRPAITPQIELFNTFPGVTFEEVAPDAVRLEAARPMRVGSVKHLLKWKRAQNRPKDQADIALLESVLGPKRELT
jgi:hypothetical protein